MALGHPYGRLPYLEERLDNGQVIQISQSFTVCRYLARKYNLAGATLLEEIKADEYTDCVKDMLKCKFSKKIKLWTQMHSLKKYIKKT